MATATPCAQDLDLALPGPGAVDVWRVELIGDTDYCAGVLSSAERSRLARRCGDARRRFVRSHGALRDIAGAYMHTRAADVELYCAYGAAPWIPGGLRVSLSHCEEVALIAVARRPVGVDAETLAAAGDDGLDDLADLVLHPRELAAYERAGVAQRPRAFARLWTRKEAVLKARGEGIGDRLLSELEVGGSTCGGLALADLELGSRTHLVGAVALDHPEVRVRVREWWR
jgi:4'-phosphopantetheinyl transferase